MECVLYGSFCLSQTSLKVLPEHLLVHQLQWNRTKYVDGTLTSEVTPVTIPYIHPPHHGHTRVNIMVMNGWLTSLSIHVNRPYHSWDKAISNFDLETSRSRSWVWSKGIQLAQYFVPFRFHINQTNNSWDTAISKFDLEKSKVKVFFFHINRTDHSWDMANSIWPWKNTSKILKK